jgi:DNA polymerase-3 subunit alpha
MTSEISDSDRINVLLAEAHRMGIGVLPPDVNESGVHFSVSDGRIRFGLYAVKNVGEAPARAIDLARREAGQFETMADLVSSLPSRSLNRRALESLVAAGACDSLEGHRAQQHKAAQAMIEFGQKASQHSSSHDLFAVAGAAVERVAPPLPEEREWSTAELLAQEKAVLGVYLSGHPLDKYRDELGCFATSTVAGLSQLADGREVTIGGLVVELRRLPDKRGNMMAFASIEDFTGKAELVIFSDCYEKGKEILEVDQVILVTGRVSTREGEKPKVVGSELVALEKLTERYNCQLVIKIDTDCSDETIDRALQSLEAFRGPTPVLLAARENGSEVYIRSKKYAVNLDFELLSRLKELLGDSAAYLRPLGSRNHRA